MAQERSKDFSVCHKQQGRQNVPYRDCLSGSDMINSTTSVGVIGAWMLLEAMLPSSSSNSKYTAGRGGGTSGASPSSATATVLFTSIQRHYKVLEGCGVIT